jgi:uncharacterized protein (TIGR00369 family)
MSEHPVARSGTSRLVGYRLAFDGPGGAAVVTMPVTADHANAQGNLHGGLMATVLDVAMGATVSKLRGNDGAVLFSTVTMTINYLAPMPMGGTLAATGRVTGGGYKTVFAEAVAHGPDGAPVATASGVFKRSG